MKTIFVCLVEFAGLAATAILLAGCQTTPPVHAEYKPNADFSHFKTFALLPLLQTGPVSDPGLIVRLAGPARQAVNGALGAKGFTEAAIGEVDFTVHLHGQSIPQVDVTQLGYSKPVLTRWGGTVEVVHNPDVMVSNYEQRTLTVEVFDARRKEVVWVGWTMRDSSKPVKVESVTNAVYQILDKFPSAGSGAAKP